MSNQKPKQVFNLSARLRNKLPEAERAGAEEHLAKKSGGKCALCDQPLGSDPKQIVCDHILPQADGEKHKLANLYLAHRSCNSSRQAIPFELAKPLIEFKVYCEHKRAVTFEDVLERYVPGRNQNATQKRRANQITIEHKSWSAKSSLMTDPATNCEFFFMDLPIELIKNDEEVQPRLIMHPHVRKILLDISERPVHEPSNCRMRVLQGDQVEFLQFDGQHKTTAQILLDRKSVVTKVYVEPDISMLQELVVKIQQEIKKQPLTRSDTLAKLGDVIQSYLKSYKAKKGEVRTETGFVESVGKSAEQKKLKKLYFEELQRIIFFDEDNELAMSVRPGVSPAPTTDRVVIDKIIKPLMYEELLDVDIDSQGGRDDEREVIVSIMNKLKSQMLRPGWDDKSKVQGRRVDIFFKQGAIAWWMNDILIPSIRYVTKRLGDKKPLFTDGVSEDELNEIDALVETLCNWDIWSTDDVDELAAFRSNTRKNVIKLLGNQYDEKRLIKEALE